MGLDSGNVQVIQLEPPKEIEIDVTLKENPIAFQIADAVKKECLKAGCAPYCFGMDDSSESSLCDVVCQSWSPQIHRIVFQSAASELPVSLEENRPAKEMCKNKRAEMYLFSRSILRSGQLKGVDHDTAQEMCSLEVDESKPVALIQSKKDYRATHAGHSPDYSDCLVMLLEVARRRGFQLNAIGQTKITVEEGVKSLDVNRDLYSPENLWKGEEDLEPESELIL